MKDEFRTIEIAPAVRLCSYETDRFTTGIVTVRFTVPLTEERYCENAMLPLVLTRSNEDYPTLIELTKRIADLYGAHLVPMSGKRGDTQEITLGITTIDNKFALEGEDILLDAAKFLFGLIFRPNVSDGAFLDTEVEQERRIAIERVINELNDKRHYAAKRMKEEMFAGEAYALNSQGSVEGLQKVTSKSLYEAYLEMIKGAAIQINVVGSSDAKRIADLFESCIADVEREPAILFTSVLSEAETVKRVVEELPVNQGKLVMGFRLGATDMETEYEKYKIMCDVFGGGVHSRLFNVVREEMSLCYYCSSRCVRDKEFMMVQSGIENENAEVAEKEILNQLRYVVNDLTEDDLEKSKLSMKDMLATVCDTPDDIMGWMLSQAQEEFVTPEEHLEKLMAVTLEDVRSVAAAVTLDTVYLLKGTGEVQS